jgi:dephospho-CoA kinase
MPLTPLTPTMPLMPRIIAICGAKRSGKDVLAEHLVKHHKYERVAFANPLKQAVKVLFNFNDEQVETDIKDVVDEKWGITPRAALQFFGTEIMQEKIQELLPDMKRNFFANTLKNYIAERCDADADGEKTSFVISDMRFLHEYEMLYNIPNIRKEDVLIIRVIRPSGVAVGAAVADIHKSELEYVNIPYDVVLVNNSTIENYLAKFDKIMEI